MLMSGQHGVCGYSYVHIRIPYNGYIQIKYIVKEYYSKECRNMICFRALHQHACIYIYIYLCIYLYLYLKLYLYLYSYLFIYNYIYIVTIV